MYSTGCDLLCRTRLFVSLSLTAALRLADRRVGLTPRGFVCQSDVVDLSVSGEIVDLSCPCLV